MTNDKPGKHDALDDVLARALAGDAAEDAAAARVLAALAKPLPRQKFRLWTGLPGVLLDWQFAPSWPRMAALAGCAALGFALGITAIDGRLGGAGAPFAVAAATDFSAAVFEPEPLTGLRP